MKTLKSLFVACMLLATTVLFAKEVKNSGDRPEISKEVSKLLEKPDFKFEENIEVKVVLSINENNEMVVLSVNADEKEETVEGYIKSRLNYTKLKSEAKNKTFVLPVKMVSNH